MDFLDKELQAIKSRNLYRTQKRLDGPPAPRVTINGRECILLSSNNYLSLAAHPEIMKASAKAAGNWGAGAGASRLISGNLAPHEELERKIACFKNTESAIVFNTGYMANLGVISALTGKEDIILSDELNHASIIDGCRLSHAETRIYRHCDMDSLEKLLKETQGYRRRLIVTDGVFSMDGDIAPLPEIADLADKYGALVMVDDAHATGVLGKRGAGTAEHFGLEGRIQVQMGTLSKALGCFGAYVAGSHRLTDYLRNKARSYIFSTALPPAVTRAAAAAIEILENNPGLLNKLRDNAAIFREGLKRAGYEVPPGETPIIPVFTGDEQKTLRMAEYLLEEGAFAPGIRPPTVPPGKSRIRVSVMAGHSREDLIEAVGIFERAGKKAGVI
ncbi:MAG: 8-amino-7-oxononanoate synthase [Bacillota bacterium]